MYINKDNRTKTKRKVYYRTQKNREKYSLKVFKSNLYTYALVLDENRRVLTSFITKNINKKGSKLELAKEVGIMAGKYLLKKKITNVYFDRNGYKYHGRVKAVAEGARESGVKF